MRHIRNFVTLFLLFALIGLTGCQSVQYRALETVGIEKRDVLSSRVDKAAEAQDDAVEQFASALEQFRATVEVDGGDLEKTYSRLEREYERSQSQADEVSERIDAVEHVAEALFEEWAEELEMYSDPDLKRRSQGILTETRQRYSRMMRAMRQAESSMAPVLDVFQDQVLFLKHNLNAMAIAAIRDELADVEQATEELIEAMNQSISEARSFIDTLG
jgi:septal ring factor EnvC (AmiA/AmiB activator)